MGKAGKLRSSNAVTPKTKAKRRLAVLRSSPSSPKRIRKGSVSGGGGASVDSQFESQSHMLMSTTASASHQSDDQSVHTRAAGLGRNESAPTFESSSPHVPRGPESGGLLSGKRPSDVSQHELRVIVSKASDGRSLFGDGISASEMIEKTFEWFGCPSINVPWFVQRGTMLERAIIPSKLNRELQDM